MERPEVKKYIEELLTLMEVKAEVVFSEAGGHEIYTVSTDDSKILIGHQGETLRALNLVVRRAFESKIPEGELHFRIDINGYYADRDGKLVREARQLAERARLFKYDIDMRPLNPYERMIVHEALRDFGDIATESKGEGMARHIVVCYRPGGVAPTDPAAADPAATSGI